jgi:hypothetical protein
LKELRSSSLLNILNCHFVALGPNSSLSTSFSETCTLCLLRQENYFTVVCIKYRTYDHVT